MSEKGECVLVKLLQRHTQCLDEDVADPNSSSIRQMHEEEVLGEKKGSFLIENLVASNHPRFKKKSSFFFAPFFVAFLFLRIFAQQQSANDKSSE